MDRKLNAFKRNLLDPFPLEGHKAAGEHGVNTREVCFRNRSGLSPVEPGRESLDYGPGQWLHLHCCYLAEQIHWVWNTARSDKMANVRDKQEHKNKQLLLTESLVILKQKAPLPCFHVCSKYTKNTRKHEKLSRRKKKQPCFTLLLP